MKGRFTSFAAGVLVALALIGTVSTAFASDDSFSLKAYPIQVLVNGEVFKPKDVNGKEVPTFTVDGTTYAPVRALAEAYGLEVSYDAEKNMASVSSPKKDTDFADAWEVTLKPASPYDDGIIYNAKYKGGLSMDEFKLWWKSMDMTYIKRSAEKMAEDLKVLHPGDDVTIYFAYNNYNLGSARARDDYSGSNFDASGVWIK